MLRILIRIILGLGAIVLVAGFAVYGRLSTSLPQIDGVIEVVGPDSDVTVERDEQGLVTIRAANRRDRQQ